MAGYPNSQRTALVSQKSGMSGLPPDSQPVSTVKVYPWEYFAVCNGEYGTLTPAEAELGSKVFKHLHPHEIIPMSQKESKPIDDIPLSSPPKRIISKVRPDFLNSNEALLVPIKGLIKHLTDEERYDLLKVLADSFNMEIE